MLLVVAVVVPYLGAAERAVIGRPYLGNLLVVARLPRVL